MKMKKIRLAQVLIIAVILLAIILPQVIGVVHVSNKSGNIEDVHSLKGMVCALTGGADGELIADSLFAASETVSFENADSAADAVLEKKADFLICLRDDAFALQNKNSELYILPYPIDCTHVYELDEGVVYYAVIRKSDYAFGTTSKTLEGLNSPDVHIACLLNQPSGEVLKKKYPSCTVDYYNSNTDAYNALANGKADYCVSYIDDQKHALSSYPDFAFIPEPIHESINSFTAPKNERGAKIVGEFNKFLEELYNSGEYEKLQEKWTSGDESKYKLEDCSFSGKNGVLKVVTCGVWTPNSFYYNNEITGFYIDLVRLFSSRCGYTPEISTADYGAELAGIASGTYDLMADIAENTPEREKNVTFTLPIFIDVNQLIVHSDGDDTVEELKVTHFINSLKDSFIANFIVQDRYKMLLDGLLTTILIAVFAALFGTLLGVIICALRISRNTFCNAFARLYIKIIQGIPIVVFLMILFYVVFSESKVSGFWVSVIGFSIDFSAYAAEIFRSGIESVSPGQAKAARALGFSAAQAMRKVVIPQALRHILPVYSGQFISMIKMTSVVGYIAVQDLTKMSDLIRSFTYEAFFPLITTAIIYFALASLLLLVLKLITKKTDPQQRSRLPKGVTLDAYKN